MKICRASPLISHLFFADDALFFIRATLKNCKVLDEILKNYCLASGQVVNLSKSSIFFSANTPRYLQRLMSELLGMCFVENPGVYLGLPTIWGR